MLRQDTLGLVDCQILLVILLMSLVLVSLGSLASLSRLLTATYEALLI